MPTYLLVNIKYLLTLRVKLTWYLTHEAMLAHLLKILLWVSVVLALFASVLALEVLNSRAISPIQARVMS